MMQFLGRIFISEKSIFIGGSIIILWWLMVEVDVVTLFIPISTLIPNCTVKPAVFIVIVILGAKFHPIVVESIVT